MPAVWSLDIRVSVGERAHYGAEFGALQVDPNTFGTGGTDTQSRLKGPVNVDANGTAPLRVLRVVGFVPIVDVELKTRAVKYCLLK